MDVGGAPQAEQDRARAHRQVRQAVDHDERAAGAILGVGREGDRLLGGHVHHAHLVQRQRLGRELGRRVHVHLVLDLGDARADRAGAGLQAVEPPRYQLVVVHPDDVGRELVRHFRPVVGRREHVAARHVHLVPERQRHRLARHRPVLVAVERDDPLDGRGAARAGHDDRVARAHRAA